MISLPPCMLYYGPDAVWIMAKTMIVTIILLVVIIILIHFTLEDK